MWCLLDHYIIMADGCTDRQTDGFDLQYVQQRTLKCCLALFCSWYAWYRNGVPISFVILCFCLCVLVKIMADRIAFRLECRYQFLVSVNRLTWTSREYGGQWTHFTTCGLERSGHRYQLIVSIDIVVCSKWGSWECRFFTALAAKKAVHCKINVAFYQLPHISQFVQLCPTQREMTSIHISGGFRG